MEIYFNSWFYTTFYIVLLFPMHQCTQLNTNEAHNPNPTNSNLTQSKTIAKRNFLTTFFSLMIQIWEGGKMLTALMLLIFIMQLRPHGHQHQTIIIKQADIYKSTQFNIQPIKWSNTPERKIQQILQNKFKTSSQTNKTNNYITQNQLLV